MTASSSPRRWRDIHWFLIWLRVTGQYKAFVREAGGLRLSVLSELAPKYGFVGGEYERNRAQTRISLRSFANRTNEVARMEREQQQVAEAEEESRDSERFEESLEASVVPRVAVSDPDYPAAVRWVSENWVRFIRVMDGKPNRLINKQKMSHEAPNKTAVGLMVWACGNMNKFQEIASRVLAKPQERAIGDDRYIETDKDLDSLRRALRDAETA